MWFSVGSLFYSLFGGIWPVAILKRLKREIPIAATLATIQTLHVEGGGVKEHQLAHAHAFIP
jgi:hypothetical protein